MRTISILALMLVASVTGVAAQTLAEACRNYEVAVQALTSPSVPFPVRGVFMRTGAEAAMCAAKPPSGDAATVQDAANEMLTAAAPYAETRP